MSRPDREGSFRKFLILAFLAFVLTICLVRSDNPTQAQAGCPEESYVYCDENFGLSVNPYTCTCSAYCSISPGDCNEWGSTFDFNSCTCERPLIVFEPCDSYSASINCGGDPFNRIFSGITWVYGTGNCNPEWANRCGTLGGSFNYNDCNCDLGPAYIPPSASPTPPALERCPQGSAAQQACAQAQPPGKFDTTTCTCKWGP